jgi:hypothetical protein
VAGQARDESTANFIKDVYKRILQSSREAQSKLPED